MIHISKIDLVTEHKDGNNVPIMFSFKAITLKGTIITGENCIVTASNNINRTRNIKYQQSGEIRKLRNISFIEINSQEIIL